MSAWWPTGSLGGGILAGKGRPKTGGKELRSEFYPFYDEPMWSKCQKLLDVLRILAAEKGTTVAQVSINWVLAQPGVVCSLMGATKPEKAAENAKAGDWELNAEGTRLYREKIQGDYGIGFSYKIRE